MLVHHAVSIATVAGLSIVLWHLWNSTDVALTRLKYLLLATAAFYSARSMHWLTDTELTRTLTIVAVSLLPLLVLLVVEQLMRRHAALGTKVFIASGTVLFTFGGFAASVNNTFAFIAVLLAFQLLSTSLVLWLIYRRDRHSLSTEENLTLNRISLILIIIVPLLVSDYVSRLQSANLSGLGVLCGCWILVHMHDRVFGRIRLVLELAILMVFSLVASLFVAWHSGLSLTLWLQVWAMLLAFTIAAATVVGVFHLRWHNGPIGGVTQGLLQAGSFQSYMATLRQLSPGCVILEPVDLSEYNHTLLIEGFNSDGSVDLRELPSSPDNDRMTQSQLRHLLHVHGAERAYLVARQPLHIAVAQRRGLADGPDADLLAAFSLARLLAHNESLQSVP